MLQGSLIGYLQDLVTAIPSPNDKAAMGREDSWIVSIWLEDIGLIGYSDPRGYSLKRERFWVSVEGALSIVRQIRRRGGTKTQYWANQPPFD